MMIADRLTKSLGTVEFRRKSAMLLNETGDTQARESVEAGDSEPGSTVPGSGCLHTPIQRTASTVPTVAVSANDPYTIGGRTRS